MTTIDGSVLPAVETKIFLPTDAKGNVLDRSLWLQSAYMPRLLAVRMRSGLGILGDNIGDDAYRLSPRLDNSELRQVIVDAKEAIGSVLGNIIECDSGLTVSYGKNVWNLLWGVHRALGDRDKRRYKKLQLPGLDQTIARTAVIGAGIVTRVNNTALAISEAVAVQSSRPDPQVGYMPRAVGGVAYESFGGGGEQVSVEMTERGFGVTVSYGGSRVAQYAQLG